MSLPDNTRAELQDTCPILANTNIDSPFTIPNQYFEDFQIQLKQIIQKDDVHNQNELSTTAPFLSKLEKINPFDLPINYFNNFKVDEIVKKEVNTTKHEVKLVVFSKWQQNALKVAATILLIAASSTWIYLSINQNNNKFKTNEFSQISQQECNEFLVADQAEIPMEFNEKENIANNVFNVESSVTSLKEVELQQFLTEFPEFQSNQIN